MNSKVILIFLLLINYSVCSYFNIEDGRLTFNFGEISDDITKIVSNSYEEIVSTSYETISNSYIVSKTYETIESNKCIINSGVLGAAVTTTVFVVVTPHLYSMPIFLQSLSYLGLGNIASGGLGISGGFVNMELIGAGIGTGIHKTYEYITNSTIC